MNACRSSWQCACDAIGCIASLCRWGRRCVLLAAAVPGVAMAGVSAPACDVEIEVVGTGLGGIPDSPAGGAACGEPGVPRDVTFSMVFLSGYMLADLMVSVDLTHPWLGDVTAALLAPDGTPHTLFGRVGATTAGACGDSSDFNGTYAFSDFASPPFGGLWQAASATGGAAAIPSDAYRSTNSGGAGAVNPMPATSMLATFTGPDAPPFTGNWTARFTDAGEGDLGTVSAARLYLCLVELPDAVFADGFEDPA